MELFRAKKVGEVESNSIRKCRACDQKLELIRAVLYPGSGNLIRVFECKCGERVWDD